MRGGRMMAKRMGVCLAIVAAVVAGACNDDQLKCDFPLPNDQQGDSCNVGDVSIWQSGEFWIYENTDDEYGPGRLVDGSGLEKIVATLVIASSIEKEVTLSDVGIEVLRRGETCFEEHLGQGDSFTCPDEAPLVVLPDVIPSIGSVSLGLCLDSNLEQFYEACKIGVESYSGRYQRLTLRIHLTFVSGDDEFQVVVSVADPVSIAVSDGRDP
jgi:hypothetical protein